MMDRVRTGLLVAALGVIAAACTAKQTIDLKGDGSGTAAVRFAVEKPFVEYFTAEGGKKVFDAARVKAGMERRPGFAVKRIATPTPETLEMDLAFADIRSLFADGTPPGNDGVISVTQKDGRTTVALHLDRKKAKETAGLFAEVSNPAFKEMSPRQQRTRTEKEYLEAIEFAVGDQGPALMKASYLELTVRVDGTLVGQTGGRIVDGAAVFKVPLLKMLLLEQPLDYSVTFVPTPKKGAKKPKA